MEQISGAFPLLFGQGPLLGGAAGFAGGFGGTKIGGQMGGFAGGSCCYCCSSTTYDCLLDLNEAWKSIR